MTRLRFLVVALAGLLLALPQMASAQYVLNVREADIRAYVIADNKLAENAGWDADLLALEFQ